MSVKLSINKPVTPPGATNPPQKEKSPPLRLNATDVIHNTASKPEKEKLIKASSNPFKGFARIFSLIWKSFKRALFGSDKKNDRNISDAKTVSSSAEDPISEIDFLDVAISLKKKVIPTNKNIKITDPVELQKERLYERKKARRELLEIARDLKHADKKGASLKNGAIPKGQNNLGNTCHLNSALQLMENSVLNDPKLLNLIKQDLTRLPNESMEEMEDRLLSQFLPIPKISSENVEELRNKIKEIQDEMKALDPNEGELKKTLQEHLYIANYHFGVKNLYLSKEKELEDAEKELNDLLEKNPNNLKEKDRLNQRICFLKYDLLEREDKILFKWSFLLLLQAKAYGTDAEIHRALKAHHQIVFMIGRHADLKKSTGPFRQQDASAYIELWQDMFERKFEISAYRIAEKDDMTIVQDPEVNISSMVRISKIKDGNFISSLKNEFFRKNESSKELEGYIEEKARQEGLLEKAFDKPLTNLKLQQKKIEGITAKIENLDNKIKNVSTWTDANGDDHLDFSEHYQFAEKPPEFLNFQIGRFIYDEAKQKALKNSSKLAFDLDENKKPSGSFTDVLDLSPYFKPSEEEQAKYQLIGFVRHIGAGSADSGHYTSYVCRGDKWYLCNDGKVSFVKTSDVPFGDAYILNYKRIENDG